MKKLYGLPYCRELRLHYSSVKVPSLLGDELGPFHTGRKFPRVQ
jgi:hypothetical protein